MLKKKETDLYGNLTTFARLPECKTSAKTHKISKTSEGGYNTHSKIRDVKNSSTIESSQSFCDAGALHQRHRLLLILNMSKVP